MWPFDQIREQLYRRSCSDFGGLIPQEDAHLFHVFINGGIWALMSHWIPRHFEIARLSYLFKQAAEKLGRRPRITELGCGHGLVAYLLALEGADVHAIDNNAESIRTALKYQRHFARKKGDGHLQFAQKRLEKVKEEELHMVLCIWPDTEMGKPLLKKIKEAQPEIIVIGSNCRDVLERGLDTDLTKIGYTFETGWRGAGWRYLKDQLERKNFWHNWIEVYTRDGLRLKLPKNIDDAEPYPWEMAMPDITQAKEKGLYVLRKRPFRRN